MAIVATDVKHRLSTTAGSAGNSNTGAAGSSLGKYISTSDLVDASVQNLFLNVSSADASSGKVYYQCLFIYNSHGTQHLTSVKFWIESQTVGGGDVSIGVDTTAASAVGNASAQALQIANANTAPTGVSFSIPTTEADALSLGTINSGQVKAVWFKLTVAPDSESINLDDVVYRVEGVSDP